MWRLCAQLPSTCQTCTIEIPRIRMFPMLSDPQPNQPRMINLQMPPAAYFWHELAQLFVGLDGLSGKFTGNLLIVPPFAVAHSQPMLWISSALLAPASVHQKHPNTSCFSWSFCCSASTQSCVVFLRVNYDINIVIDSMLKHMILHRLNIGSMFWASKTYWCLVGNGWEWDDYY